MNTNTVASDPVVDGARERLYVAFHREIIAHCGPNQLIRDVDDGIDCEEFIIWLIEIFLREKETKYN